MTNGGSNRRSQDLGHVPIKVLERQLVLVNAQCLGLLLVDSPPRFADPLFQTAVRICEQFDLRAKLFVVGLLALQRRDLLLERPSVSLQQRLESDSFWVGRHDEVFSTNLLVKNDTLSENLS